MPDNCVRFEAAFVEHNSIFTGHCPMPGANIQVNIQVFLFICFIEMELFIRYL